MTLNIKKERIPDLYKYLCITILIFGTIVTGCVSTQNDKNSEDSENSENVGLPFNIKNIKINNADNETKRIIYRNLKKIDQNVTKYILSINIVSETPCKDGSGCTINNFTSDGKLIESNIYILHPDAYKDSCDTFEHVLYHELGHITYFYKYGNYDINKDDIIYQESIESYVEKYADDHSPVQKEGCNRDTAEVLRRDFREKEKTYQYAIRTVSKWDKYNSSIPPEMKREYEYDYELYQNAKNEYNLALDIYKNYVVISNNISR